MNPEQFTTRSAGATALTTAWGTTPFTGCTTQRLAIALGRLAGEALVAVGETSHPLPHGVSCASSTMAWTTLL